MERRSFVKTAGMSAFAVSMTGFKLLKQEGAFTSSCATSRDMLGPFFRDNAPKRNDLTYPSNESEVRLKVIGKVFGADCQKALANKEIDIWHCDHKRDYDMRSDEFRCRGKIYTNEEGEYWFKTMVPPPYQGRPKHIHYLIHETDTHHELVTQLYFQGDKKIKKNNWVKYRWDEKRILEIYENDEGLAELRLDLFLKEK